ncbi:hypothetical protein ACWCQZ_34285 [Streptomyces sp. NPDC002285]
MSASTLPHTLAAISNYCWQANLGGNMHCTLPRGHSGRHWHAYSKTSW